MPAPAPAPAPALRLRLRLRLYCPVRSGHWMCLLPRLRPRLDSTPASLLPCFLCPCFRCRRHRAATAPPPPPPQVQLAVLNKELGRFGVLRLLFTFSRGGVVSTSYTAASAPAQVGAAWGLWPVACGLWPVACGLWPGAWGLGPVACGLRSVVCGL